MTTNPASAAVRDFTIPLQPVERAPDFTPLPPTSIGSWWATVAARHADRTAVITNGMATTYGELESRSAAMAKGLIALGLGKGARVGIMLPNGGDWIAAWIAVSRIGGIAVTLSTFASPAELKFAIRHADCAVLLTADRYLNHDYVAKLAEAFPGIVDRRPDAPIATTECPYLRHVFFSGESPRWSDGDFAALMAGTVDGSDELLAAIEAEVSPSDEALLMYTSGSTAHPKAVIHIHSALVDKIDRLARMKTIIPLGTGPEDRMLVSNPFFWVGGWISMAVALEAGAAIVLIDDHSPGAMLEAVRRHGITQIGAQPGLLGSITQLPDFQPDDFAKLRIQNTSQWPFFCQAEGKPATRYAQAIGMTETIGPHSGYWYAGELPEGLDGTMGPALEGMEFRITDPETGAVLPIGTPGELEVRGIWVMDRFYKRLRSETFTDDGFYGTGDQCTMDSEGRIWFHHRLGGMIKTSGANVSPEEVEFALRSIAGVIEAAAFPVDDSKAGQVVAVAIVRDRASNIDEQTIGAQLRPLLSSYKIPKIIRFVDRASLPRTPSDKIRRGAVAELFEQGKL